MVLLGDSNTWLGGEDCTKPEGWNTWFKTEFAPRSCRSYARSGATWTNTPRTQRNTVAYSEVLSDDNTIYNQICRLEEAVDSGRQAKPDLIIILAGTNDAWFQKQRGWPLAMSAGEAFAEGRHISEAKEATTLATAVRLDCELLRARYPEARIVLLTPFESVQAGATAIRKAGDIIADCGRKMGIDVVRLDRKSGICAAHERANKRLTKDGTHTSVAGARQVGTLVARELKALLKD